MKKIGVIGSGTMGSGIVQIFAQSGFAVTLKSSRESSLEKAKATLDKSLSRLVKKEKMTEEQKATAMGNVSYSTDFKSLKDCDLVIEATVENMDIKKEVFAELDKVVKPEGILATNTSSLSITEIAASVSRPDKVIGMHFFNPVPMMKLVEIIKGITTSDESYQAVYDMTSAVGKEPVQVEEAPGFVVNRILIPMINEAVGVLADGVASAEDIDKAMKLGANHPIGPLALADLIGNDVNLAIMEVLYSEFGDPKYRPHPLLRKMVRAGLLGRKSGEGFYKY
ncbi:MAG: 3-hydroxybutyryl-CoA dehydrogenase [Clostridiales bacterium]|nr:MAG: 3-hydroxybutyryl-CoA dehydrogenase [Clostridiales bacterium]